MLDILLTAPRKRHHDISALQSDNLSHQSCDNKVKNVDLEQTKPGWQLVAETIGSKRFFRPVTCKAINWRRSFMRRLRLPLRNN